MSKRVLAVLLALTFICVFAFSGCQSSKNDNKDKDPVTITNSFSVDEVTEETVAAFKKEYPNITLKRITLNTEKLMAMIAAGSAPDVWRANANEVPMFVNRGLLLPIDDYVKKSGMNTDDFDEVMKFFQYDGKTFGQGPRYGFVHGWTTDHSLWVNKLLFEENGLEIPSANEPITYDKLFELSKALLKKDDNGNIITYGLATWLDIYSQSTIMLKKMGKSFWSTDFKTPQFSSEAGIKVIKFWTDFAKSYACNSTLNPISDGWGGPTFLEGKVGIVMLGYNFNTFVRDGQSSKDHVDDFIHLPSPIVEGYPRVSWIIYGAAGGVINKDTKNPDEAFTFLKWFLSGKQTEERTRKGWAVPPYKSMVDLLPVNTDFDRRCLDVHKDELKYLDPKLEVNPFATPDAVGNVVKKYTDEVLYDKMSVEDACKKIDEDLLGLIKEGMEIAGVE